MFELNDLFEKVEIKPENVLVMRHSPTEPKLKKVMPWLVIERRDLFDAYQHTQSLRTSRSMVKVEYVASCLGREADTATFVGLYKLGGHREITPNEFWENPLHEELRCLGMDDSDFEKVMLFDMEPIDYLSNMCGRLVIKWPPPMVSWFRPAHKNTMTIKAMLETSEFNQEMPPWDHLTIKWSELSFLPKSWQASLREWRGVYLIFDEDSCRNYVGSAYGVDNILGRWMSYAQSGHGGNRDLKGRNPSNFRFSILQRVSPDLSSEDVIQLEASWKRRLHTIEFGLNKN